MGAEQTIAIAACLVTYLVIGFFFIVLVHNPARRSMLRLTNDPLDQNVRESFSEEMNKLICESAAILIFFTSLAGWPIVAIWEGSLRLRGAMKRRGN